MSREPLESVFSRRYERPGLFYRCDAWSETTGPTHRGPSDQPHKELKGATSR